MPFGASVAAATTRPRGLPLQSRGYKPSAAGPVEPNRAGFKAQPCTHTLQAPLSAPAASLPPPKASRCASRCAPHSGYSCPKRPPAERKPSLAKVTAENQFACPCWGQGRIHVHLSPCICNICAHGGTGLPIAHLCFKAAPPKPLQHHVHHRRAPRKRLHPPAL